MALIDQISAIVYAAANNVGGTTWDVTLKKKGAATADGNGGYTQSTTSYSGRGFIEEYSDAARALGGIPLTDRKAILFDASFTAGIDPEAGDVLTAEATDYEIVKVSRDPAEATWTCQIRG